MRQGGVEPPTTRLTVGHSTDELLAQVSGSQGVWPQTLAPWDPPHLSERFVVWQLLRGWLRCRIPLGLPVTAYVPNGYYFIVDVSDDSVTESITAQWFPT